MHRFPNEPVDVADGLHWNILELYRQVLHGLRLAAGRRARPAGHRAWTRGRSTTPCSATARCSARRTTTATAAPRRGVEATHAVVDHAELYARNGLQFLPFNTIYQLMAEGDRVAARRRPADGPGPAGLLADRRAGRRADERLHDRAGRAPGRRRGTPSCSTGSACRVGVFPPLVAAGTTIGKLHPGGGRRGRRDPSGAGHRGGLPRHGLGRGRGADARRGRGVHLLRHLGAGRARARRPRS